MFGLFKNKKREETEFLIEMMSVTSEELQKQKIDEALNILDIKLKKTNDHQKYCIKTTVAFVRYIVEKHGTKIKDANDNDIITSGVFLFAISSHITKVMGVSFEIVSSLTILELFYENKTVEDLSEYIPVIGKTYNKTLQSSKIIDAIGQNFVKFLNEKQTSQFEKLIQIYEMCRNNISDQ